MSRCFPYPDNGGVVVKGTIRQTPTEEPIKLQKERLRIHDTEKRSRNVRNKDNDETSHKRADVVRERTIRFVNKGSESKKLGSDNFPGGKKESDCLMRISKMKEDSCESVVSEEHGQPISPTSFCSLSKTRKDEQSKDAYQPLIEKRGSVFRIRLSSRKQPAAETPSTKSPAKVVMSSSLDSHRTDGHIELASTSALEPVAGPSHSKRVVLEPEPGYESLLDQWVPPPLNLVSDASEVPDWLVGTKQSEERCSKRLKTEVKVDLPHLNLESDASEVLDWLVSAKQSEERCSKRLKTEVKVDLPHDPCSASSWPPRASYLLEAEIHALPYTVLF